MIVEFAMALGALALTAGAAFLVVLLVRRRRAAARAALPIPFDEQVLSARLAAVVPTTRAASPAPARSPLMTTALVSTVRRTRSRQSPTSSPRWRLWLDGATVTAVVAFVSIVMLTILPGQPAPDSRVLSFTGTPRPDQTEVASPPPTGPPLPVAVLGPTTPPIALPPPDPLPTLDPASPPPVASQSPAPPNPPAASTSWPTPAAAPNPPPRPAPPATPRPTPRPTAAPKATFPPIPTPPPTTVPLPNPDFSPGLPVGLSVTFVNTSRNAPDANWDFGDGATSTAWSPTHDYAAAGTYQVTLTVTNSHGSRQLSVPVTVP